MSMTGYSTGLHELGGGCWAWLQPDGSWGWSNAGLIADGDASLLVDTLYDVSLTRTMLDAMRAQVPAARKLGAVVNTHANGDHCYGNQLVTDAPIIASRATAEEMKDPPPSKMVNFQKLAATLSKLPWPLSQVPAGPGMATLKEFGEFFQRCFGNFAFSEVTLTLPTETFSGRAVRHVGGLEAQLIEVGPAHTHGDTLVWVPQSRTLFTGDILFHQGHPIVWAGPFTNWLKACDLILGLEAVTVVPGHGPLAGPAAVQNLRSYLQQVWDEARPRLESGMGVLETALDLDLGPFASWGDGERLVVNVDAVARELRNQTRPSSPIRAFILMTTMDRALRKRRESGRK